MPNLQMIQLVLQIWEGNNFHLLDQGSSLIFRGTIDSVTLSTDLIPLSSLNNLRLEIAEELIWKMSQRNFQRLRATKALKLECIHCSSTGAKSNLGYIIISLKAITNSSKSTKGWRRLLGNNSSINNCPQLLLSACTQDDTAKPDSGASEVLRDGTKLIPQMMVKNGLTYIGPERFCRKKFQVTCKLQRATNLNLLVLPKDKDDHSYTLHIMVLGQMLNSKVTDQLDTCIEFNQTFVFDVMSSQDMLTQYLKDNASIEVKLFSDDSVIGSNKHFIDQLQCNSTLQLICILTTHNQETYNRNMPHPSVDILLELQALDFSEPRGISSIIDAKKTLEINDEDAQTLPKEIFLEDEKEVQFEQYNFEDNYSITNIPQEQEPLKVDNSTRSRDAVLNEFVSETVHDILATDSKNVISSVQQTLHDEPQESSLKVADRACEIPVEESFYLHLDNLEPENEADLPSDTCSTSSFSKILNKSDEIVKIIQDVDGWKRHEQITFLKEMKIKKERLIAEWNEQHRRQMQQVEEETKSKLAHTASLIKKLQYMVQKVEQEREELNKEIQNYNELSKKLQHTFTQKTQSYNEKCLKLQHKTEMLATQKKQLLREVEMIQHENMRLIRKSQMSESTEIAALKKKVKELSKSLSQAQEEKTIYVKQLLQMKRELNYNLDGAGEQHCSRNTNVTGKNKRVQKACEDECSELMRERSKLQELNKELESLSRDISKGTQVRGASAPEVIRDSKPEDKPTHIRRLREEREVLLNTGTYTCDNALIQALTKAIECDAVYSEN